MWKKVVAAILAAAVLWGGFYYVNLLLRKSDAQIADIEGITIKTEKDTYHKLSNTIKLIVENKTDRMIFCSTDFNIEYKRGNSWHRAAIEPNTDIRSGAHGLYPYSTDKIKYDARKLDWRLPWGRCRILVDIVVDGAENAGEHTVASEFNVIF